MGSFGFLNTIIPLRFRKSVPVVHHVALSGAIGIGTPLKPALTLKSLNPTLERAFKRKGLAAVAISINSPGGSPVQSALIHARIRELSEEKKVPVLVFCEDVAASGGYWLACAGDEIYADESSVIGSIGVISAGFGFRFPDSPAGMSGRHFKTFAMKISSRSNPIAWIIFVRSCPALPTKGSPCTSSFSPGASPTTIQSTCGACSGVAPAWPTPNTARRMDGGMRAWSSSMSG